MEEQWRIYLKENAPDLYKEMLESVRWAAEWRDNQIKELKQKCKDKDEAIIALQGALGALLTCSEFDTTDKALAQRIESAEQTANKAIDKKKGGSDA